MSNHEEGNASASRTSTPPVPLTEKEYTVLAAGSENRTVSSETKSDHDEEGYPTGLRLGLMIIALMLSMFLVRYILLTASICTEHPNFTDS
jgi:hypothetical protein